MGKKNSWKDLNYALLHARRLKEKHGWERLPSGKKLIDLGYSNLSYAISNHHGYIAFRELLGEEAADWKDLEYVLDQARKIKESNVFERLPSSRFLRKLGYGQLLNAIKEYHGGFVSFRALLGEKERVRWRHLGFTVREARRLKEKHGWEKLPSEEKLLELGYPKFAYAIGRYHGYRRFRKLLGEEVPKSRDLGFTVREARRLKEKHGWEKLPGRRELRNLGYSDLANEVYKIHGHRKVRELLGEEVIDWKDRDYTIQQAIKVKEEVGLEKLPPENQLPKLHPGLAAAINRYHGGFPEFRKLLGEEPADWRNLEYALGEARKAMQENGWGRLPNALVLIESGYSSISDAITRYHGGFPRFRELLGEEPIGWKNLEYALGEARKAMQENGWERLPSREKLREAGYSRLASAIDRHYGLGVFRKALESRSENDTYMRVLKTTSLSSD